MNGCRESAAETLMDDQGSIENLVEALVAAYPRTLRETLTQQVAAANRKPLARWLLDETRIEATLRKSKPLERQFVAFIAARGGQVSAATADWWLRHHGCHEPPAVVQALVQRALLFSLASSRRPTLDTFPKLTANNTSLLRPGLRLWTPPPIARTALQQSPPRKLAPLSETHRGSSDERWETVRRLFLLWRFLETNPPCTLSPTRRLKPKDVGCLTAALHFEIEGREVHRIEDVPELLWLLSLAQELHLLDYAEGGLMPGSGGAAFFGAPPLPQQRALLEATITQKAWGELETAPGLHLEYGPARYSGQMDVPSTGDRIRARRHVIRMLAELATPQQWYHVNELAEAVMEANPDFLVRRRLPRLATHPPAEPLYRGIRIDRQDKIEPIGMHHGWLAVEGTFVSRFLLESLRRIGIVDTDWSSGEPCFLLTEEGARTLQPDSDPNLNESPPGRFFVQPNFEITADGGGNNIRAIWRLAQIADLRSYDWAAVLELSQRSVVRGLEAGLTRETVLDILSDGGRVEIPQNVAYSVHEWIIAYDQYEIYRNIWVIEVDDAAELDKLQQELPGCLVRLGRRVARVIPDGQERVERALVNRNDVRIINHAEGLGPAFTLDEKMTATPLVNRWHWYPEHVMRQIAKPVPGTPRRFRLTRDSVRRGLSLGLSPDMVEQFVETCAETPLTATQRMKLRGWLGRYGPAHLASMTLLALPQDLVADALNVAGVRALIEGWISPSVFVVRPKARAKLKRLLESAGISVDQQLPITLLGELSPLVGLADDNGTATWGRRKWRRGDPEPERLRLIEKAIHERRRIWVEYESVIKGESPHEWVLSPQATEASRWGQVRLHAYCHARNMYRAFDISRISQLALLDEVADYPEREK
ncbi:MAG: helicase-associated domain-containing protein [Candidatus Zipacnadales bacterium]